MYGVAPSSGTGSDSFDASSSGQLTELRRVLAQTWGLFGIRTGAWRWLRGTQASVGFVVETKETGRDMHLVALGCHALSKSASHSFANFNSLDG